MTSPIAFFDQPEDFAPWLMAAADAYGSTLLADSETGTTKTDTERLIATEIFLIRAKGLAPVSYHEELSFADHILRAAGLRELQSSPLDDLHAHHRHRELVDDGIARAIRKWRAEDGAAMLYLLLGLALRRRSYEALETVRELLARGEMVSLPDNWKKCLGYEIAALSHSFAAHPQGQELLAVLPNRKEFWTSYMSGLVCSGLALNRPDRWMTITRKFQTEFRRLEPVVARAQRSTVVEAVGLGKMIVDTCAKIPLLYGWKTRDAPDRDDGSFRLLKDFFGPLVGPIEHHVTGEVAFKCGSSEVELRSAVMDEAVLEAFVRRTPADDRDLIDEDYAYDRCRAALEDLSERNMNDLDEVDFLSSALAQKMIRLGDDLDPWDIPADPTSDIMKAVDRTLAEQGQSQRDVYFNMLEHKFNLGLSYNCPPVQGG